LDKLNETLGQASTRPLGKLQRDPWTSFNVTAGQASTRPLDRVSVTFMGVRQIATPEFENTAPTVPSQSYGETRQYLVNPPNNHYLWNQAGT